MSAQDAYAIHDWQMQRAGDRLLLGIATCVGVLDIETSAEALIKCLAGLKESRTAALDLAVGRFGSFEVTLSIPRENDEVVAFWIDGPEFEPQRTQSIAMFVYKSDLIKIAQQAIDVQ